ncbi:uncharacterized protein OCT59_007006 [Rhizophagus irregularis]|uniref:Uncharacterized protein n=1 Tax=Rhizophagus irregularis (strain DAOM 181602 / DAOM 197198 / MUCL 43194) TaxID=747089 RepID=U9U683_RHIID|nr:hypothetical protein GLOIN_2v1764087 [Rhizophagus irregularis DAOM 181602=DAOM 197198]POG80847.1 hypothetical protein GLOIN_2v1764087 [Rhizophagus irregularis DAOM 181602=DAOM 197198]UZO15589.1 hypothetical protein OCT59_007006 [Rhizophagus irregularis]GBC32656.1 hypothetical protein RIR_jg12052.t1 [Rhizophagus irregularis DAOM 181602=DAOM 197198]|eukprot:XP_025187713.1 hypothetical protein GLOIN_2v1764087 [Rhizophagus irregularis DAOM 181602=DAOM 197198]
MGPRRTLRKEEKLREEDTVHPSVEPEEVVIDFRDDQQSRDLEENDDMLSKIEDDESDAELVVEEVEVKKELIPAFIPHSNKISTKE